MCNKVHISCFRRSRVRGKKKQCPLHRHCQVTKDLLYFSSMFSHIHIAHGFGRCSILHITILSVTHLHTTPFLDQFQPITLVASDFSFNYPPHDITVIPRYVRPSIMLKYYNLFLDPAKKQQNQLRNSASSIHKLSSPIFPCSFVCRSYVRTSRIGNISTYLHYMMF